MTLGSFLRAFRFGHVRQLDAVAARFLTELAARTPILTGHQGSPAAAGLVIDVDDTIVEVHGYAKQGAGFGYSKSARAERAAGHCSHPDGGAGDRGTAAAEGVVWIAAGTEAAGRRRRRSGPPAAAGQPTAAAGRFGVLRPRAGRRGDPRRLRCLGHRPPRRDREGRDRPRSPSRPGSRSSIPTQSSTSRRAGGSLGPRSPRSTSPRSLRRSRPTGCPDGW